VQLKPGATVSEEEMIRHCRDSLARYKIPKKVVFGALPTTATGKIQKYVLRERAKSL
jgi:fatty-acyl-CoA synthase